ncbi:uncharacterized protein LOC122179567 isoform X3 [Lagopus leucura]|uniref:uncharacterized protein LOC122179567 isoform X3 n=1 Tax=Lagopus leucura TaxID=30410 RepID=UPI001C675A8C|nr:uncharacterized protein LOC122179567 isoform X3 [Lagopus leucura]
MGVIRRFPRVLLLSQLRLCSLQLFLTQVCVVSISRRKYDVQSSKSEKNSAFSKASLSEVGLSLKEPDVPTSVCRLRTDRSCWIQLHFLGLMNALLKEEVRTASQHHVAILLSLNG